MIHPEFANTLTLSVLNSTTIAVGLSLIVPTSTDFETVPELLGKRGYLSHLERQVVGRQLWTRGGFTHGMTRGFPQPGGLITAMIGLKIGRTRHGSRCTSFIDRCGILKE